MVNWKELPKIDAHIHLTPKEGIHANLDCDGIMNGLIDNLRRKASVKTIYLFRHSKPEKATNLKNELIPLSEEGRILLAKFLDRNEINRSLKIFSSPYQRAYETSKLIGNHIIVDERLVERKIGLDEAFSKEIWMNQYVDCDLYNEGGESFRMVRCRMTEAINEFLSQLADNESIIVVSHAAAICAYLQQFCEIKVTDADKKQRCIMFQKSIVLDGVIDTPSCFELIFEDDKLSHISYKN